MIVGVDVTVATHEDLSGIGYHIIRVVEAMQKHAEPDVAFRLFYLREEGGDQRAIERLPLDQRTELLGIDPGRSTNRLGRWLLWRVWIPRAIRRARCDVFHGPSYRIPLRLGIPTVVSVHDMAFFRHDLYDEWFNQWLRETTRRSVLAASRVIALSDFTRRDVAQITGRSDGVELIYGAGNYANEADRARSADDAQRLLDLGLKRPFVLYVGGFGARKNLPFLLEAFASREPLAEYQLVLAGHSAAAAEDLYGRAEALGLKQRLVLTGRVNDEQLKLLYRNASAFALCSLGEGFTLVTLEAMSFGVPVVATDTTSIAEGIGEAGVLVEPGDPGRFADALLSVLTDPQRAAELSRAGLSRYKRFSWSDNAKQTLALYREIAGC